MGMSKEMEQEIAVLVSSMDQGRAQYEDMFMSAPPEALQDIMDTLREGIKKGNTWESFVHALAMLTAMDLLKLRIERDCDGEDQGILDN